MSKNLARSIRKAKGRELRQSLDRAYNRKVQSVVATPVSPGLAMVRGSLMPAVDMPATGSAVAVTNIGRAAAAKYAPDRGSATAVFVSGGGSGSGGGATYSAGAGLQLNADVFSIKLVSGTGLTADGSGLTLGRDTSLQVVSDQLGVKAGAGLAVDANGLKINVGDGVYIDTDTLKVKLGATNPRLSFDGGGLQVDSSLAGFGLVFNASRQLTFNLDEPSGLTLSASGLKANVGDGSLALDGINNWLKVNVAHAFDWTAKHTWGGDTMVVNPTNKNVWINAGQPDGSTALRVKAASISDTTLAIQQLGGQTGRMLKILDSTGQELIVLDEIGNLQSGNPGYVSGLTGWQIAHVGNVEFLNGFFRGELHASVFVMDEIHANGGSILVASSSRLLEPSTIGQGDTDQLQVRTTSGSWTGDDILDIRTTSGSFDGTTLTLRSVRDYLDVEDPPSGHAAIFSVGETLRCKFWNGSGVFDLWFTVLTVEDQTDFYRYYVQKRSGTATTIPAGVAVVSYGFAGDGRILLTSDLNYAPYIDVFTVGASPWTGLAGAQVPHVRMGRLDGVGLSGIGTDEYGIVAGTDLSDANSPYLIASNQQLALYKVSFRANNGGDDTVLIQPDGVVKFGTDVNLPTTTGFHFDAVTGNLIIGQLGGDFLQWNQGTGVLSINGVLTVGGSSLASESYVDGVATVTLNSANAHAESYADGVGTSILGDAEDYADAIGSSTLGSAQTYADGVGTATLGTANTYADGVGASTLSSAQADATSKATAAENNAKSYTDSELAPIAAEVNTNLPNDIATALANAQLYAGQRRISAADGTFTSTATTVSWNTLAIRLGTGEAKSISNGSLSTGTGSGRWYLFVNYSSSTTWTMQSTTYASTALGANSILIAVVIKRSGKPAQVVTAISNTIIDGNNIVTGTITANQVAADAIYGYHIVGNTITASKLAVVEDGDIEIGNNGYIHNTGKTTYASGTGFFLGYHSGAYKLDVGDSNSHIRWDGSNLTVRAKSITAYQPVGTGTTWDILTAVQTGRTMKLQAIADGWRVTGGNLEGNGYSHGLVNWSLVNGNLFTVGTSLRVGNLGSPGNEYFVASDGAIVIRRDVLIADNYDLYAPVVDATFDTLTLTTPGDIAGAGSGYYVLSKLSAWAVDTLELAYYYVGEYVTVQGGLEKSGNINGACGRMPVGLRPPYNMTFPCRFVSDAGGGAQMQLVQIGTDGYITLLASPTTSGGNFQFQFSYQATQ